MSKNTAYLVLLLATAAYGADPNIKLKLCMASEKKCKDLNAATDAKVSCEPIKSRMECAQKLVSGNVDFGMLYPEELHMLKTVSKDAAKVVAYVYTGTDTKQPKYMFESVAVVSKNYNGNLTGLQNGTYCVSSASYSDHWSPRVLKEFERQVAPVKDCPAEKTADELEAKALSSFFKDGCRPGTWSADPAHDAKLKKDYKNLCSLCDEKCETHKPSALASSEGAVKCLKEHMTKTNNTVAYVSWADVQTYITDTDVEYYAVLCPDNELKPLTASLKGQDEAPCSFVKQPWRAIVAVAKNADLVKNFIETSYKNGENKDSSGKKYDSSTWQSTVFSVVASDDYKIKTQDTSVEDYVKIMESTVTDKCQPKEQSWCVTSQNEENCKWLGAAASSLGVQPNVACVKGNDALTCMDHIRNNKADFAVVSSHYGYLARKIYNLDAVKIVDDSANDARIVALVTDATYKNNINSWDKLKNTRACFPEYGGLEQMAFTYKAQNLSLVPKDCDDYGKIISDFFNSSCVPGADDQIKHHFPDTSSNKTLLCSLCKPTTGNDATCAADSNNAYYGNKGALSCLKDTNIDVAFVNLNELSDSDLTGKYILCLNKSVAATKDVVEKECVLAHVIGAEVLTRGIYLEKDNLASLLYNLQKYSTGEDETPSLELINFNLFHPLDKPLIEPNKATPSVNDYYTLMDKLPICPPTKTTTDAATTTADGTTKASDGTRSLYSLISIILLSVLPRYL